MKYVYLLQSMSHPDEHYVGLTKNLKSRLAAHNAGQSPHTSKYLPWKLITYLGFTDDAKAAAFEKYLKTGSGQAFRKKHF